MKKETRRIIEKSLGTNKIKKIWKKIMKENILPEWVKEVKNEIEDMSHEEYVKDVEDFVKKLEKEGVEKVLFEDI
jgi:vacuolar-type H+-ATPase subunit E/Vma4